MLLFIAATICFASFAWGMAHHFRREGKPAKGMVAVGVLAALCTAIHLAALALFPARLPIPALTLYLGGIVLFWSAVRVTRGKLAACGQGLTSADIIRQGPYRLVRHPFYTSYNLVWAAGFLATLAWPLALSAIMMAAIYHRAVCAEESAFLAGPLGRDYKTYMDRTGRYLPRLNTKPSQSAQSAS